MTDSNQKRDALRAEYRRRYDAVLKPLADALRVYLADCLRADPESS
jgi:hypothetical protein